MTQTAQSPEEIKPQVVVSTPAGENRQQSDTPTEAGLPTEIQADSTDQSQTTSGGEEKEEPELHSFHRDPSSDLEILASDNVLLKTSKWRLSQSR